jgi:hypothetical protein
MEHYFNLKSSDHYVIHEIEVKNRIIYLSANFNESVKINLRNDVRCCSTSDCCFCEKGALYFDFSAGAEYCDNIALTIPLYQHMKSNPESIEYLAGVPAVEEAKKKYTDARRKGEKVDEYKKIYDDLYKKFYNDYCDGWSMPTDNYWGNYMKRCKAKFFIQDGFVWIDDTGEYGPYVIPTALLDDLIDNNITGPYSEVIWNKKNLGKDAHFLTKSSLQRLFSNERYLSD